MEGGQLEGGQLEGGQLFLKLKGAQLKLVELQRRVLALASHDDLEAATERLHALRHDSAALVRMAEDVAAAFEALRCQGGSNAPSVLSRRPVATLFGLGGLSALVALALRGTRKSRSHKVLINKVD